MRTDHLRCGVQLVYASQPWLLKTTPTQIIGKTIVCQILTLLRQAFREKQRRGDPKTDFQALGHAVTNNTTKQTKNGFDWFALACEQVCSCSVCFLLCVAQSQQMCVTVRLHFLREGKPTFQQAMVDFPSFSKCTSSVCFDLWGTGIK